MTGTVPLGVDAVVVDVDAEALSIEAVSTPYAPASSEARRAPQGR
ncbi:hypothetical protein [Streptomyces sp. NPDC006368]